MESVDFATIKGKRNDNFNYLHNALGNYNYLELNENLSDCFCYPLLRKNYIDKNVLANVNLFIPTFWKEIEDRNSSNRYLFEKFLSQNLLPLPIDHRYGRREMDLMVNEVSKLL